MNMKKRIDIFLMGGTGNNFFQLALGSEFERRGYRVRYNTFLRKQNFVTRILGWSIHEDKLINYFLESESIISNLNLSEFLKLVYTFILYRLGFKNLLSTDKSFFDEKFVNQTIIGYWQEGPHLNFEVYKKLKDKLTQYFIDHEIKTELNLKNRLVCHYRAGDFPKGKRLSSSYYFSAFSRFPNHKPLIVTNDINELNKAGFEYQESVNLSLEEDFLILFSADKLVCSNSTLCFWAAALGKSSKSVIPSHLIFRNKKEKNTFKFFDKDIVIIPASYD